ncbi:serine:threonine protein kinase [Nitzschia inconspicua]|uniref:Serine:threonine protein kinase n=1 Tax=Nitzschia inconspicua TaxID=303405 RepID=A0A9K3PQA3_9STRA|nr:serine:threonine protein kinase [Nitzschia inconspicua]
MHPNGKPESQRQLSITTRTTSSHTKLVVKRKKNAGKTKIRRTTLATRSTSSAGLPSFHNRRIHAHPSPVPSINTEKEGEDDDNMGDDEDIPSEVLVAVHSIIQANHGLAIPLSHHLTIQAVMEHQIYSTFDDNNATNIHRDLLELVHTNKLRQLYCQDKSSFAYVLTNDFCRAVWDTVSARKAQQHGIDEELVAWFLSNLHLWTGRNVPQSAMEIQWESYCTECKKDSLKKKSSEEAKPSFHEVLHLLLDLNLLIRDTQQSALNSYQENHFFLWLPQWAIALKAWNDARKQLLAVLARGKETSTMNLLRKNRHTHISTQFLLQDLIHKGKATIIQRPFGSFVQLVKDAGR